MNDSPNCWKPPAAVIFALVLLRLAIGWHFYREGTKKLAVDPTTHELHIDFSAEGFLKGAVGPLATFFHQQAPGFHSWEQLLAQPAEARPMSEKDAKALADWQAAYAAKRKAAVAKKEPAPVELPPVGPYVAWAQQVVDDWHAMADRVEAVPGLTSLQQKATHAVLDLREEQLAAYLAAESPDMADWQHELWRLHEWEVRPEAADVPFEEKRIAEKRAETTAKGLSWVEQVRGIERGLKNDLKAILTPEQAKDADMIQRVNAALADVGETRLARTNLIVTCVVIGVGVLLMLGLFTRLASVAGIAFLLSVIATQPPWVPGANTLVFYYQTVEIAALVVLFATAAGRWAGLDFFMHAAARCCRRTA